MHWHKPRLPESSRLLDNAVQWAGRLVLAGIVLFLVTPAALVIALSFSNADYISFPPPSWGFRQYQALAEGAVWLRSIWLSVKLAAPTALLSVAIAVLAAYAIHRTRLPGGQFLAFASLTSLIAPVSAYAVALYGFYALTGLLGRPVGIVLSHTVLAFPLALLVTNAALTRIPQELELVAMTLGASRWRAWIGITGRLLVPGLIVSFVFAFLTSFDEAVFINFLGGPGLVTLPKAIFDSVRFGVDPLITAIATILMIISAVIAGLAAVVERHSS